MSGDSGLLLNYRITSNLHLECHPFIGYPTKGATERTAVKRTQVSSNHKNSLQRLYITVFTNGVIYYELIVNKRLCSDSDIFLNIVPFVTIIMYLWLLQYKLIFH